MAANMQSMCQYWKNFNLPDLQKELDTTATELANRQDESDASRKRLVEQSRLFKKNTPEDIRKVVAPLLKSFQAEIDNLSKRSKAAEAAILSVYKKLIDLPDPVEALDQAVSVQKSSQRVNDLEIENKQLRDTLTDYNNELAEVKHQEVTIKSLKEKLKDYDEKIELTAQTRAKDKERELQRAFTEKEKLLHDSQVELARKLGESENRVVFLEKEFERIQSSLFDVKSKYDESITAKTDEMDIIMADLERANERAAMAERDAETLKVKLAERSVVDDNKASVVSSELDNTIKTNMEFELSAKEKQITQLVDDLQKLQASMKKQQEISSMQIASLELELESKTKALSKLDDLLQSQQDYVELKRELEVLKSIEFPNADLDSRTAKSLEVLLLEKNKVLQSENTQLKVSLVDSNEKLTKLQDNFAMSLTSIQSQKELIGQLEEDLRSMNAISSLFRGDAEGEASKYSTEGEMVAEAVKGVTALHNDATASSSLLPIVQSQRERYRIRSQELEAQTVSQQQQLQLIQNEADKLRLDNVKLYEKIKFLQSYPTKGVVQDDGTENKYSRQYEERINPFATFERKERQRKYMDLKPYEKITLSMGRFIMGNKVARMVTFFYTILLHCLVFVVLYKIAHTEDCKRDLAAECHQKFSEHMKMAHGQNHI